VTTQPHQSPDPSRRQFLAAAGATVAAAAFAELAGCESGHGALGGGLAQGPVPQAQKRVPLKEGDTVRMAVIGMGGPGMCAMGPGHIDAFTRLNSHGKENVQIVALCDVNKFNLEHGRDRCMGGGQAQTPDLYSDYKKVLARDDIHGVLLAVPEHWHAQMAIDSVLAGKDVYLEKPMTLRLDDAIRLRRVLQANPDIRLQVGTQMTNLPRYHEAKKIIAAGGIGTPTFTQCSYCRNSKNGEWHYATKPDQKKYPGQEWVPGENLDWDTWCGPLGPMPWDPKVYSQWRRYRKTSTGIIGDLLVHEMTPMIVALGDQVGWPTRVSATGAHLVDKEMENHDNVNIVVQFESGHQMFVCGSTCNEVGVEKMIRGHKGNIYLGNRQCVVRPERVFSEEVDEQTVDCPDIGDDQDMHRVKWLHCIRTREQPDSDVEQGTKVMVIVDLATRSMWEGGAFTFDPKTMRVRKA
jgi:predicted dehydrogenase